MLSTVRARQLFRIHRWTGLVTGIFILFLSLTGAALVFIHEIDRILHPGLLVSEGTGPTFTPDEVVRNVLETYPHAVVGSITLPEGDRSVYTVTIDRLAGFSFNQVMVDPYTGRIRGTRDYGASLPFILRQLHLRFYAFGWQGRVVVGLFGLVLLVSATTGLLIYGRFIRALPRWWSIRRERGRQFSTSDWHKLVGITALAFNLVIALTGAVLGLENLARYSPPASAAMHPRPDPGAVPEPPTNLAGEIRITAAIAAARRAVPDLEPVTVTLPRVGRGHYVVRGNQTGRIAMAEATSVGVHALSGEVFFRLVASEAPAVTRAYNWIDPLHFGTWGSVWSKILYVVFGLTTGFLSISGFLLWYIKTRRPAWAVRRAGRSPARAMRVA